MDFEKDVIIKSRNIPVLVKFTTHWCGPCKSLQPILEQNQLERTDYETVYVDIEKNPSLAKTYNIRSVPTLILFLVKNPIGRINGMVSKVQLNNWLDAELPVEYKEIK